MKSAVSTNGANMGTCPCMQSFTKLTSQSNHKNKKQAHLAYIMLSIREVSRTSREVSPAARGQENKNECLLSAKFVLATEGTSRVNCTRVGRVSVSP